MHSRSCPISSSEASDIPCTYSGEAGEVTPATYLHALWACYRVHSRRGIACATHRCLRRFLLPYGIGSSSLTTTEKPASVRSASVRRKLTTYKAEISGRHSRQTYQADTSGRHIRQTNRPRRHQDTHFGYTSVTHQIHIRFTSVSHQYDERACAVRLHNTGHPARGNRVPMGFRPVRQTHKADIRQPNRRT